MNDEPILVNPAELLELQLESFQQSDAYYDARESYSADFEFSVEHDIAFDNWRDSQDDDG